MVYKYISQASFLAVNWHVSRDVVVVCAIQDSDTSGPRSERYR